MTSFWTSGLLALLSVGRIRGAHVISQKFFNVLTQEPHTTQVLPLCLPEVGSPIVSSGSGLFSYDPSPLPLFESITNIYFSSLLHSLIREHALSEHSARFLAMGQRIRKMPRQWWVTSKCSTTACAKTRSQQRSSSCLRPAIQANPHRHFLPFAFKDGRIMGLFLSKKNAKRLQRRVCRKKVATILERQQSFSNGIGPQKSYAFMCLKCFPILLEPSIWVMHATMLLAMFWRAIIGPEDTMFCTPWDGMHAAFLQKMQP